MGRIFSGSNSKSRVQRILGGTLTPIQDAPYMAAILDYDNVLICGGSILSTVFIVTAAHCLVRYLTK